MAATLVATQGINAYVLASVLHEFALVHVQHECRREAQLLDGAIGHEFDEHLIAMSPK